ncbi:MAG: biotin synthase BioB [Planctomycetes bacterium]|nr:biotin synthase BioB [Planctomycetota bacterium]
MNKLTEILANIFEGKLISHEDAKWLVSRECDLWNMLHGANTLRTHFKGDKVNLCSIINAKSGSCAEDCKFCAQSSHHSAEAKIYPLVSAEEIKKGYKRSAEIGAHGFSIVTSGNELTGKEINAICKVSTEISSNPKSQTTNSKSIPYLCGSLGRLSVANAKKLKDAGMIKCHHNLETSRRFFSHVCSSHTYDERIETIKSLKKAGLKVCSGGIFGMGETWEDRIDMALTLRELEVDSVPLNFLIPIKGTMLEGAKLLTPQEILRTIAIFRYVMPKQNIRICAGREKNLRDMQSWIFYAGADGMMIGGYLTQPGRSVEEDLQMIKDLGLSISK